MASPPEQLADGKVSLYCGDCLDVLKTLPDCLVDSCVTDPPYHLTSLPSRSEVPGKWGQRTESQKAARSAGFMGKAWDGGDIAFRVDLWREVLRVMKPGAHLLAMGGDRTVHRLACAIEDAGFEIRGQIAWVYSQGFPKSLDISKAIDRAAGAYDGSNITAPATDAAKQWDGWGTALKPAMELIVLARKPLSERSVAANVLRWGVGGLNIDGCRVGLSEKDPNHRRPSVDYSGPSVNVYGDGLSGRPNENLNETGRWPANIIHDGSDEVIAAFPQSAVSGSAKNGRPAAPNPARSGVTSFNQIKGSGTLHNDSGSAARFFYSAKADSDDRLGSKHPTVKPVDLIQYLARLITPRKGLCLDLFAGTGTTGEACIREGFRAVLIERETEYQDDIRRRMKLAMSGAGERKWESIKQKIKDKNTDHGPLFGEVVT